MQYSENLNFNLPEMTDPPDISKLIENWSNLDPIIQNIIIGLTQVGNAAKVNGYTVNANVPAGAKFTDTVTTVNGKTGAITKADVVALGIPAQDTVYIHPDKHAISEVDGLQTALNGKVNISQVLTNVPAGAVFTDTVTTINGKTGAISKADIVALGIPASDTNTTYAEITTAEIDAGTSSTLRTITGRRVKYLLDKVQGWINALTKSDIGLGDVENYSIATQSEAESGTANNRYMTPLGTKQAINTHNIYESSHQDIRQQINSLDANKVDNSRVLTDVPVNAKFTDTVTTINGKTGTITKADIVALGIPAQDTNTTYSNATTSAAGLMSAADKTKLDGVATGANNYSHPTSAGNKHIPSGGASGNLLGYSSSGTAKWVAPSTINAGQVDGKSVWVGAEGSKGTDANTIYFCY